MRSWCSRRGLRPPASSAPSGACSTPSWASPPGWSGASPRAKTRRQALALFCAQLALNALWSWLFFQWHRGAWALADIALLGICVAATFVAFLRLRTLAGLLLLPYLAWISFAGALNYTLWRMNPGLLG